MLNVQALIRLNRQIAKCVVSMGTVTLRRSENVPVVRKHCRCTSNFTLISQRDTYSKHRLIRFNNQINCVEGISTKIRSLRELSTTNNLPVIYLFTKDGCTLCDEAKEALRPHMHRFILNEVDITLPGNEHWYEMYKYDIPVFHIYEEFLFQHRVDFDALERGLEKYKDGFKSSK